MSKVLAILCADLHLSHTPPVARSAEKSWYAAQKRPLDEIRELARLHGKADGLKQAKILCAGDIFDSSGADRRRWNSPPELINFALDALPEGMYCIPGQHDLPNHNYGEIGRSAYWTLAKAGKLHNIPPGKSMLLRLDGSATVTAFPWGYEIEPPGGRKRVTNDLRIVMTHAYCWVTGRGDYPGVSKEKHIGSYEDRLKGYDVAVFGDNHQGFTADWKQRCKVFNCGTMMRRKQDEREYKPRVGLLLEDGTIESHCLDTSLDKFADADSPAGKAAEGLDVSGLVASFESLGVDALDFKDAVNRWMDDNEVGRGVRERVLGAVNGEGIDESQRRQKVIQSRKEML